jgi:hypothetical protein
VSAEAIEPIDVRCPLCGAKQFMVVLPGMGIVQVLCRRHSCRTIFLVDVATGKAIRAGTSARNLVNTRNDV